MQRRHPLDGIEISEENLSLRPLQRHRPQLLPTIESQQPGEQPFAQPTVPVVENEPVLLGLRLRRRNGHVWMLYRR